MGTGSHPAQGETQRGVLLSRWQCSLAGPSRRMPFRRRLPLPLLSSSHLFSFCYLASASTVPLVSHTCHTQIVRHGSTAGCSPASVRISSHTSAAQPRPATVRSQGIVFPRPQVACRSTGQASSLRPARDCKRALSVRRGHVSAAPPFIRPLEGSTTRDAPPLHVLRQLLGYSLDSSRPPSTGWRVHILWSSSGRLQVSICVASTMYSRAWSTGHFFMGAG